MAETLVKTTETGTKLIIVDNPTGDELTPEQKKLAEEVDRYAKWCDAESPRRFKQKGAKGDEAKKIYTPVNIHLAHTSEGDKQEAKPQFYLRITWVGKDGKDKESGRLYDAKQFEADFEAADD
jgi:hypothetical protein